MRVLVSYATRHGSTREIAQRIAERLESSGLSVDCRAIGEVSDLSTYDAALIGSAIHDQEWLTEATDSLARLGANLAGRPVWLFSVGMPAALPRKLQGWAMQEEGQMEAKLARIVRARGHRLFSGVVRKQHLTPKGRVKFRIMGGRYGDFRDWTQIETWAQLVADDLTRNN